MKSTRDTSPDPENPTGKGGVAVVLSKNYITHEDVQTTEIVPGRALLIRTNWRQGEMITILNVYAPNVTPGDASENAQFWRDIAAYYEQNRDTPKPQFMLGDFNMVETAEEKGFSNHIRPQIHIIMASFYREVDSLPNRGICYAHPVFFFCFVCIV